MRLTPMVGDTTQFITDSEGRKIAIVLPVEEYEELLEDMQDLAVIAERRGEPHASWDDVKQRLRMDGILHD